MDDKKDSDSQAFVNVVKVMGGDIAVINAASRLSKTHDEVTESDKAILTQIVRERRGRPFEQAVLSFYIRVPMFVALEWIVEQIGSFNLIDTTKPEFYVPKQFRVPDSTNSTNHKLAPKELNETARGVADNVNGYSRDMYNFAVGAGISNEHARLLLPGSTFVEFRWTVNARDLMRFISAHIPNHKVVRELRLYAAFVEKMFQSEMPASHAAFMAADRIAP